MCTKLTGHNTESVGQAVGVRSDKRCKQSTFGVDTTACTAVVPTRYPATRGYGCHWSAEAGVPYPIAGKYVVWEEGKPRTIESRQAEVSRSVMVVEPMTQQGQWSCFGPDRAFAYQIDTGRVIPFESTPNGRNLTVALEGPDDANSKFQEVMDIMMTEQTEKVQLMSGLPYAIKQMLTGPEKTHFFWVASHRPARPNERSLKPLTETDGDETMMDNHGDDDTGETSAVKSKSQPMGPLDQEIARHEACGHYPYRDWCRACVGSEGRSDAHKRQQEEQHGLPVASMDYGFFTGGQEQHTERFLF